jgi:hypothetical protein
MQTDTPSPALATRIETAEVNAWVDMYAALPREFGNKLGFEIFVQNGVVMTRCKAIPFVHFNCVKNLGLGQTATEAQLDQALATYAQKDVTQFSVVHEPNRRPASLAQWFSARGLSAKGSWDRIYRAGSHAASFQAGNAKDFVVEAVTPATAARWAGFIDATYGLPNSPWLVQLVGRPGWHHYLLSRSGKDVCARSMFINADGAAWFCIDAPVPGVMGPCFDDDARLCEEMVNDGQKRGATLFVADIEMPAADKSTPAYQNFAALGFKQAFLRQLYSL